MAEHMTEGQPTSLGEIAKLEPFIALGDERIRKVIDEVSAGIREVKEHMLASAFANGMHPGSVQFHWQILQRGGVVCWLNTHYARPATPEERAEIEARLRASIRGATESSAR